MKRIILLIIVGIMLVSGGQVWGSTMEKKSFLQYPSVAVMIKDACNDEVCGEGFNVEGTTYVPLRLVLETMGADVKWNENEQKEQSVEIIRGNHTQANETESEYIKDTEQILFEIDQELTLLTIFDQQLSLAHELYNVANDTQWITQMTKGKLPEHKSISAELIKKIIEHQKKHPNKHQDMIKLTDITKKINEIVDNYEFSLSALERLVINNQDADHKTYLLHRRMALEHIETTIKATNELKSELMIADQ